MANQLVFLLWVLPKRGTQKKAKIEKNENVNGMIKLESYG